MLKTHNQAFTFDGSFAPTNEMQRYVFEEIMRKFILCLLGVLIMSNSHAGDAPDFSHVNSREKAIALVEKGELFQIYLFPIELGGKEIPPNAVYVPVGIPEIQSTIIGTLIRFADEGLIDNLNVEPEYKGDSFVPSKIKMHTYHSGKAGEFNPTIEIW